MLSLSTLPSTSSPSSFLSPSPPPLLLSLPFLLSLPSLPSPHLGNVVLLPPPARHVVRLRVSASSSHQRPVMRSRGSKLKIPGSAMPSAAAASEKRRDFMYDPVASSVSWRRNRTEEAPTEQLEKGARREEG
eukprot:630054-Hanusia_phi.AAC.1